MKERLKQLLNMETRGPTALVELNMLLAKLNVGWLLPAVEEKARVIEVGEEDLDGLFAIVSQDGLQSKVRIRIMVR